LERGGFEPPKASPADLQSAPFDRSGTSPASWREDLNPQQADYKSAALPIELRQRLYLDLHKENSITVNYFLALYLEKRDLDRKLI
jgi:hypothetical protein